MSKPSVARGKVVRLHPSTTPDAPVTLADITIQWEEGGTVRTATGSQVARLLTRASEEAPSGLFMTGHDSGVGVPLLRGLSDLVFPDPRDPNHLDEDTRFFISETLLKIAAATVADEIYTKDRPRIFTVLVKPDSGLGDPICPRATPEGAR